MVPDQQAHRNLQICNGLLQRFIGGLFPPMGQIAGNDDACGIRVMCGDIRQGLCKPRMGIQPAHFSPGTVRWMSEMWIIFMGACPE